MGRRRAGGELIVRMNGDLVGRLVSEPGGRLRFTYDASWLASPRATPISTSLPLARDAYVGARVASFFDNLLPDGEPMRQRMQATLSAASTRPFDLLAVAGRDCVGAIQLLPDESPVDVRRIDAEPIRERDVASLIRSLGSSPLGLREGEDFRMSLAGAHEKTALLRHRGKWKRPHGATPTSHVLKPAIGQLRGGPDLSDSVENEWLSLRLTGALGLPVARAEIETFEDQRVLVVERFDRHWSRDGSWLIRLPQEDFCQALGVAPALKYEADGGPGIAAVMHTLLGAERSLEDRATFFRANVVAWLLAGIDAHAKNYSVFLLPGGTLQLAPIYDVLSAYPVLARKQLPRQKIKLAMAVLGTTKHYRWAEVRRRHWLSTAERTGLPREDAEAMLVDLAARIEPAIAEVERALPHDFPASVSDPIFEGVRAMRPRLVG
jgi:serine/threonine-protein kinase HipA